MKDKCFEIGIIQAFVDGELESSVSGSVTRHLAGCDVCSFLVDDLRTENEMAFGALDAELNVLVPTERLRRKVLSSIHEIESSKEVGPWGRIVGALGITGLFARPGIAAFASLAIAVGVTAIGFKYYSTQDANDVFVAADTRPDAVETIPVPDSETGPESVNNEVVPGQLPETEVVPKIKTVREVAQRVSHRENVPVRKRAVRKVETISPVPSPAGADDSQLQAVRSPQIASEDSYLTTIATLNRTVDENKDYVLRPSERVAFERDLAVVNDAIKKMRGEVKKNPNNSAAREILQSSYENKVVLLKSVAARSELVAARD